MKLLYTNTHKRICIYKIIFIEVSFVNLYLIESEVC